MARPPAPCLGVGGPEPLMIIDLTDVARAAVSCAGASPDGAARPEPALAAVCTTATPCPDTYTHETSLMPAHVVFHRPARSSLLPVGPFPLAFAINSRYTRGCPSPSPTLANKTGPGSGSGSGSSSCYIPPLSQLLQNLNPTSNPKGSGADGSCFVKSMRSR